MRLTGFEGDDLDLCCTAYWSGLVDSFQVRFLDTTALLVGTVLAFVEVIGAEVLDTGAVVFSFGFGRRRVCWRSSSISFTLARVIILKSWSS